MTDRNNAARGSRDRPRCHRHGHDPARHRVLQTNKSVVAAADELHLLVPIQAGETFAGDAGEPAVPIGAKSHAPSQADLGARLRADHDLKTPHAIQAATALACQATGFVSNDRNLRKVAGLEVIVLDDLLAPGRP